MTNPHSSEKSIFLAALERESPQDLAAFLDQACAGDQRLRAEVDALLAAHERLGELPPAPRATGAGQAIDEPLLTECPGALIGPYKLLQKLGEGGMGIVYLAEQQEPVQRRVALKIIKAGLASAHVIGRFEQERQALAMMDHPNIAKVLDAGTTGFVVPPSGGSSVAEGDRLKAELRTGRPYFVMELVKGIAITTYCDKVQLTPRERLQLFLPVCQAVQHAHQKGIIHRDFKPSNVLIALYDGTPMPKVIDFGVAKATGRKLTERTLFTEVGQMVGTLEYMAPEQAELNNLDIDTRADIYALGVILYELLTGSPPFTGMQLRSAAFAEMLRIIREVEPPKPSMRISMMGKAATTGSTQRKSDPMRLSQLFRGELDWIVMKCLEKDRKHRYETASALARDIERYLQDEPVQACPPSPGYRLRKFVRRNKGPVLAVSLVLLALVAGIVGTTLGLLQAMANAEKARAAALAEEKAKKAEADQRLRAEVNLRKARQAVDDYFTLVSENTLLSQPTLEPLRKQLLEAALRYYQEFVREHGDDAEVQAELVAACMRISSLIYVLGSEEDWLTPFQNGVALMEDLMRKKPDVSALQSLQAGILRPLAVNLHMPQPEEARRAFAKACILWEQLVHRHPQINGFQNDLAVFHLVVGISHLRSHRHAEAIISYQKAYDLLHSLVLANPTAPHYRATLVLTLGGQTIDLSQLGKVSELKQVEREALEIAKQLMAEFPDVPAYEELMAWLHAKLSDSWRSIDQPTEALEACRHRLTAYEKLARAFPGVARYQRQVASACEALGQVLWYSGRHEEALEKYRQVSSLLAGLAPADPQFQDNLAWFLANCPAPQVQDAPWAIELAKHSVKAAPQKANFWITLGAAHYRAGDWPAAIEALTKSMELDDDEDFGWFFLAMAHWQVGNKEESRRWYIRDLKWMDMKEPYHVERRRFRTEAAKLLAIQKN
jgi:serine/threonine protein kinase/tetratricopeptide (TPR) repeat protein